MKKCNEIVKENVIENNAVLISKIYESFEALEETLGKLKLEEPLFITYIAKRSFADVVFNGMKRQDKKEKKLKN